MLSYNLDINCPSNVKDMMILLLLNARIDMLVPTFGVANS